MTETRIRNLRHAYGFDDIALVPGEVTINPDQIDVSLSLGNIEFPVPVLAAGMDGVVDVNMAIALGKLGGLAVLNLDGIQARFENADEVLAEIAGAPNDKVTAILQKVYSEPVKENLIGQRIKSIKDAGAICAVSVTPANTKKNGGVAVEAGVDVLVVQSTVTTARHISKSYKGLVFSELCKSVTVPIVVGNCVTYAAAKELMETGVAGLLIGVGPGAACTTREVLGIGVPQVTATLDCAQARDDFFQETGKYIPLITDGGIRTGGDLCKAFACGANAVMLGSILAQTAEAPGRGYHWGMATSHGTLPRGTRVKVKQNTTLKQTLFGPTSVTDGTHNLIGALHTAMGVLGVRDIKEMHKAEVIIAPAIKSEGKQLQRLQNG